MTVDINLFVMNRNVTRFITDYPDMKVWIPQYADSAFARSFQIIAFIDMFDQMFLAPEEEKLSTRILLL